MKNLSFCKYIYYFSFYYFVQFLTLTTFRCSTHEIFKEISKMYPTDANYQIDTEQLISYQLQYANIKIKSWTYLVPTISKEFTVWLMEIVGSVLTLSIDGRIWIVFGWSCKFWYKYWKWCTHKRMKKWVVVRPKNNCLILHCYQA